jgi:hypothetical protein
MLTSLGSTVEVFSSRLQRKLREQEVADDLSAKEAEVRKAVILRAMTSIRKALQETTRVHLGKRFHLQLEISDNEGWPRLELQLVDKLQPDRVDHALVVNANDRGGRGLISFVNKENADCIGALPLDTTGEVAKLPVLLKTTIRRFLDSIADFVLNPVSESELEAEKPLEINVVEEDPHAARLKQADVFTEENLGPDQNLVIPEEVTPLNLKKGRGFG